jgi:3-oxoacyl-[acyl-carrier protein] reductase|tara:strand:- start:286 stop:1002 length:717 start_codon:yes stop_codon:yes gene_type:complete
MNQILKGKNCLITGATGGLGKEIAEEFAKNGCNLFLTGRNNEKLNLLKDGLENNGIKIDFEAADLSDVDDIQKLIDKTKNTFSNIDILVNCAGVFPVKLLSDSTVDDFEKCFSVNVRAAFVLCKEFSQGMISKKWGRIVNIASSSAYTGFKNTSIYCSSKHALLGLSRSLHSELKEHNVRTFCVSPGSIKTSMGKSVTDQNYETFLNPSEIAEFIVLLVSFDNEMISQEIQLNRMNKQ